jgi:phospholipase C
MKKRTKVSVSIPILLMAVMFTANVAAIPQSPKTTTPIQHLVIIFQENVSFDHYFATYPVATNPAGEPKFTASPDTPSVNGLSGNLLTNNPNLFNPVRLDRSKALTCDMSHEYTAEQEAFDGGLMDKFVQNTGNVSPPCNPNGSTVMNYYDGNTVTALWEYAQDFAMNQNSFETTFGPSTPGVLNLVSGQTSPATPDPGVVSATGAVISDADPTYDDCSSGATIAMTAGLNVGDLMNAAGITWGWFQGGFTPTGTSGGKAICGSSHVNIGGATVSDYSAHHEPFQYYTSTANPHHLPPSSSSMIGRTDQANHQYDLSSFWVAADAGNLPAVSFLKAAKYQDGHAGYSDPLDEQTFLVNTINSLEKLPTWSSTAVIIAYDDSDGWYDHVMGPITVQSNDPTYDALLGTGLCGTTPAGAPSDRCGYGPRLPFLVISTYAKQNYVDSTLTDQSSILSFIEYNWHLPSIGNNSFDVLAGSILNMFDFSHHEGIANKLFLDPTTGLPTHQGH